MAMEYYSFEKVLNELQMDEDELKRLVSEGQIRAFRDQNRMKFRQDDIESLKKGKQTEPTIILPDGAAGELEGDLGDDFGMGFDSHSAPGGAGDELVVMEEETDETLLDLGGLGFDEEPMDEGSVPSVEFSDMPERGAETLTEELVFDEGEDFGTGGGFSDDMSSDATQRIDSEANFEDDFGMQTEPLDLHSDSASEVLEDFGSEDFGEDATAVGGMDADATYVEGAGEEGYEETYAEDAGDYQQQQVRSRASGAPPVQFTVPEAKPVGILWVLLLAVVAFLYLVGGATLLDFTNDSAALGAVVGEQASSMVIKEEWQATDYKALSDEEILKPAVLSTSPVTDVDGGDTGGTLGGGS